MADIGIRISATDGTKAAFDSVGRGLDKIDQSTASVTGSMDKISRASSSAATSLGALTASVVGIGVGAAALQLVKMADAVTVLNNQLRLSTGSATQAAQAYGALFDIAQRSRVSFTELGNTYASIARAGDQLGISQSRLLGVTEAISNAVTVSGGSAESAKAALVQLSQGLASGTLRGDELNSVMEQTPRLAKALADGLGITTGELRKLGAEGEISAAKVIKALESQSDVLKTEVATSIITVSQAWTVLANASSKAVGEINGATNATSLLAKEMVALAPYVDSAANSFGRFFARISDSSSGGIVGFLQGTSNLVGQAGFGAIDLALNTVNSSVNTLSGGIANFKTDFDTLPDVFRSNTEKATLFAAELPKAEGELKKLMLQLERRPKDPYLKNDIRQLEEFIARAKEAQKYAIVTSGQLAVRQLDNGLAAESQKAEKAAYDARLRAKKSFDADYASSEQKAVAEINKQREALGDFFTAADESKIRAKFLKAGPKASGGDPFASQRDAAKDWAKSFEDFSKAAQDAENATNGLTGTQAKLLAYLTSPAYINASEPMRQLTLEQAYAAIATEELSEATKQSAKETAEATKAYEDAISTQEKRAQNLQDQLAAQQQSNAEIGLSGEAIAALRGETMLLDAAEKDRLANVAALIDPALAQAYRDQAQALRDIAGAKAQGAQKQAGADAAKKLAADYEKAADDINRAVTDSLMRAFESGEGFAKTFAKTLEATFKTMVLRPIVSAVVSPLSQAVSSAIGIPGTSGGVGGVLNTASNLNSIFGTAAQAYGGYSTGASAASLAYANTVGAVGGDSLGALITANGGYAGVSAAAPVAATGSAVGGAAAGGLGATGYGLIALAAIAILSSSQKQFETKYGGTFAQDADGNINKLYGNRTGGEFAGQLQQKGITETVNSINATLKLLGSKDTVTGFRAGGESNTVKAEGYSFAGGFLSNGKSFANTAQRGDNLGIATPEEVIKAFGADLKRASLSALLSADDVPKAVTAIIQKAAPTLSAEAAAAMRAGVIASSQNDFGTFTPGAEGSEIIAQLIAQKADKIVAQSGLDGLSTEAVDALLSTVNGVIASTESFRAAMLRLPFEQLRDLSFDTASGLIDAAGGFDKLNAGLTSYYDNFYSEEEKRQNTLKNITTDLNAALPVGPFQGQSQEAFTVDSIGGLTRDQYRTLVEKTLSDFGATSPLYVALLSASSAFASVTPALDTTSAAAKALADAAKAAGDAAQAAADAAKAAADKIAAIAAERVALETQLLTAQGYTLALRRQEREAIDASNRAIYDRITALDDARAVEGARSTVAGLYQAFADAVANTQASVDNAAAGITSGYLSALDAVSAAQDEIANVTQQSAQALAGFAKQIRDFTGGLDRSDAGGLSKAGQFAANKADFAIAAAQAKAGDKDALGKLTSLAGSLLTLGQSQSSTALDYRLLVSSTRSTLDGIAALSDGGATATQADPLVAAQSKLLKAQDVLAQYQKAVAESGASTDKQVTDYAKDWRTANRAYLRALGDKSIADQMVDGLDTAIKTPLQNIADAIQALGSAMATQRITAASTGVPTAPTVSSAAPAEQVIRKSASGSYSPVTGAVQEGDLYKSAGGAVAKLESGIVNVYGLSGGHLSVDQIRAFVNERLGAGDALGVYQAALREGVSATTLDTIMGATPGTSNKWARENNLPQFAVGTNYVPQDMTARIHEGEAIIPKAYNPAAGGQSNTALLVEMQALRKSNDEMRALLKEIAGSTQKTSTTFDRVTLGKTAIRNVAITAAEA